ncbi:MAG TPA: flagellar hook-length control protein FliK [Burkholderiales bacterium]|jgi:hypothetical protein|nr:flagellar hook-length control protein FliK [Burkholderiales bacterium]
MVAPAMLVGAVSLPAQPLRGIAPVAAPDPAGRDFLAFLPGRTVAGLVIGRAEDGHGIVEIEGHQITVAADLPAPGTRITLKFAGSPAGPLTAAPGLVRAGVQTVPDLTVAANEGSTLVELGEGAVSLGRFAETPLQPLQLGRVAADIQQPGAWSDALFKMLRDSGTFYESHLAAWARGNYALEQLRHEPQAEGTHTAAPPAQFPGAADLAVASNPGTSMQTSPTAGESAATATPPQGVPEALQPVIREQLHALENQALPFSVEAWPGQRADLVISREDDGAASANSGDAAGWKTTLKLQLPQLGNIGATITLQGDRLWLDLSAPEDSAALLDQSGTALGNAMLAAGIHLVRSRIRREVDHAAE